MTAALLGFMAWTVAAFALGALVGLCIRCADSHAPKVVASAPEWLAGDEAWLADQPFDCLTPQQQVQRLEAWL